MSDERAIGSDDVVADVDILPMVASRARHITTCCRGRCTTELHRFFDALANTLTDTNDPRPTADLKVRGCANDTECRSNRSEDAGEGELNQSGFRFSMTHDRREIDAGSRDVCRVNDIYTDFPRRTHVLVADVATRGLAESLIFFGRLRGT